MRKQTGIRLPDLAQRQLEALCKATGMNQSAVMVTAIDRMFQQENRQMKAQTVIENVAASIAEGIISGDDARRINAGDGFTVDHSPNGQSFVRTEGLQLSDAQLAQAIALAADPLFGYDE